MIDNPPPKGNFTKISNAVLRDKSLDFLSRGILVYMLSHVRNWNHTIDQLRALVEEDGRLVGRILFRQAIHQLEAAGYVHREYIREGGRIKTMQWWFHNKPIPESQRTAPLKTKAQPNGRIPNGRILPSRILPVRNLQNNRRQINEEDHDERRNGVERKEKHNETPYPLGLTDDDLECVED